MDSLRNTSVVRFFAALLTVCLGAVLVSPAATADGMGTQYADWLRLHLPEAAEPDVERALDLASERGARTFDEFLSSFLAELENAKRESGSVETIQSAEHSTDRLSQELHFQFVQFVGEAILPGFLKAEARSQTATAQSPRVSKAYQISSAQAGFSEDVKDRLIEVPPCHIAFRFLRSSSQPLGP